MNQDGSTEVTEIGFVFGRNTFILLELLKDRQHLCPAFTQNPLAVAERLAAINEALMAGQKHELDVVTEDEQTQTDDQIKWLIVKELVATHLLCFAGCMGLSEDWEILNQPERTQDRKLALWQEHLESDCLTPKLIN